MKWSEDVWVLLISHKGLPLAQSVTSPVPPLAESAIQWCPVCPSQCPEEAGQKVLKPQCTGLLILLPLGLVPPMSPLCGVPSLSHTPHACSRLSCVVLGKSPHLSELVSPAPHRRCEEEGGHIRSRSTKCLALEGGRGSMTEFTGWVRVAEGHWQSL